MGVVFPQNGFVQLHGFHGGNAVASALNAGNDLPGDPSLQGIRLQHNISTLNGHGLVLSCGPGQGPAGSGVGQGGFAQAVFPAAISL